MTTSPNGLRLTVVPMTRHHLDQVLAIENVSFASPWSRRLFEAELCNNLALPLSCLSLPSRTLTGYMCLWLVRDEVQIQNIAVHPAFRRRGVGRYLLTTALNEARSRGAKLATLEVRPSNVAARRLYATQGFIQQGVRPGYYQAENEDALLLNCNLEASCHA